MIHVYYDGKCGLCAREIAYYASIAPEGVFGWHDITEDASGLDALGIDYVTGLKRLHAVDGEGTIHVGADAFILVWGQLGAWAYMARFGHCPVFARSRIGSITPLRISALAALAIARLL